MKAYISPECSLMELTTKASFLSGSVGVQPGSGVGREDQEGSEQFARQRMSGWDWLNEEGEE